MGNLRPASTFEPGPGYLASLRDLAREITGDRVSQAIVAFFFATTGPLVILFEAARAARAGTATADAWIFAGYVGGGILTLALTLYYRQPIGAAFSIPGAVLAAEALGHLGIAEAVGAYLATGVLLLLLGVSGLVRAAMRRVPMPVVMGMVAGVFLPFGLDVVRAFPRTPAVASATFVAFTVCSALPAVRRRFPPVLAALLAGFAAAALSHEIAWHAVVFAVARPRLFAPRFTFPALLELVVPLAVTVVAIQNAQGIAVLGQAGYEPPVNAMTIACGLGSIAFGLFGWVSACVTGPVNAIVASDAAGERSGRYAGAVVWGVLIMAFGVFAPLAGGLMAAIPGVLVGMLGGLAMLGVLAGSFRDAFRGPFPLGALISFLVTVSNITVGGVGSPFWGLVGGTLVALAVERQDFRAAAPRSGGAGSTGGTP